MNRGLGLFLTVVTLFALAGVSTACVSGVGPTPAPELTEPPVTSSSPAVSKPTWQQKWDGLLVAAKKEGSVVIYGEVFDDMRTNLDKGIKGTLGLEAEYVSGKGPEIAARYLKEREAGLSLADILFTGQSTSLTLIKPKGVITSPEPFLILPEVLDTTVWPQGKLPFLDRDRTVVTLAVAANSYITINNELVKKAELTSYLDLLNPRWKGRITIYDPTQPGAGSSWFAFLLARALGVEEGKKFMQQLILQDSVLRRDARLQVEQIARGKYAIAVATAHQVTTEFVKLGAPIEYVHIKEGTNMVYGSGCLVFPDKPPHPNSAMVVLNWLLTHEGQKAFSQGFGSPAMGLG